MIAPKAASPAKTYALVVGIQEYPDWPELKIPGAVGDACAVALWLRRRGVPPRQIRLFLSPKPDAASLASQNVGGVSLADVPLAVPETSVFRDTVARELRQPVDAELLFLFWFGHGLIKADHYPRLLFADAYEKYVSCLDLNSLTRSLRTSYFPSFRLQVFVVDICQEYAEHTEGLAGQVIDVGFPDSGLPVIRPQYELYSTLPGRRAYAKESGHKESFTARLLEGLDRAGGGWPPEMDDVETSLWQAYRADSAGKPPKQWPRTFRRNWLGMDYENLSESVRPGKGRTLSPDNRLRLIARLQAIPALQNPERRAEVVRVLPQSATIVPSERSDFFEALADASLAWPGGIEALTETLHRYSHSPDDPAIKGLDGLLDELWRQTVDWGEVAVIKQLLVAQRLPAGVKLPVGSDPLLSLWDDGNSARGRPPLFADLDRLACCPAVSGQRFPLLEYVSNLAAGLDRPVRERVNEWLHRVAVAKDFPADLQALAAPPAPAGPPQSAGPVSLMIQVVLTTTKRGTARQVYEMEGWLVRGSGKMECVRPRDRTGGYDEIARLLGAILSEVNDLLDYEVVELEIELLVSNEVLIGLDCDGLDHVLIDLGQVEKRPLGVRYNVVYRALDRINDPSRQSWPLWRNHWKNRPAPPLCDHLTAAHLRWLGDIKGDLYDTLSQPGAIFLAPSLAADTGMEAEALRRVGLVLDAGTPIALWHRKRAGDSGAITPAEVHAALEALLCGLPLDQLRDRVTAERKKAWSNSATDGDPTKKPLQPYPVVLLWDDPYRLPKGGRRGAFSQPT